MLDVAVRYLRILDGPLIGDDAASHFAQLVRAAAGIDSIPGSKLIFRFVVASYGASEASDALSSSSSLLWRRRRLRLLIAPQVVWQAHGQLRVENLWQRLALSSRALLPFAGVRCGSRGEAL